MAALVEPVGEKRSRLAEEALDYASDDSALRAEILLTVATNQIGFGDLAAARETVEEARVTAEDLGDPVLLAAALNGAAFLDDQLGRLQPSMLERAVTVLGTRAPLPGFLSAKNMLGQFKFDRGDIAGARELLEADLKVTRRGAGPVHASARSAPCSISSSLQGGGRAPPVTSTSTHNSHSTVTIPSERPWCAAGRRAGGWCGP